jgi:exopolysaccharide production protein ExoZ
MAKIANIQVMRGVAALAVTLFHVAGIQEKEGFNGWLFSLFNGWGSWGVDLFFIISGYVMAISLKESNDTATQFLLKRVIRIYPLYFILTAFYCLIWIAVPQLFSTFSPNPEWVLASLTFTSGFAGFGEPILGQGWSLEFEALFYLSIALMLIIRKNYRLEILTSAILIGLCVLGVNSIILEFSFGLLAAYLKMYLHKIVKLRYFLIVFGIASLILQRYTNPADIPRFLQFGIPCVTLFVGFLLASPVKNRFILHIGEISYSIYLLQFFVIPVFFKFLKDDFRFELIADIRGILAVITIIALSHLSYKFIEVKCAQFLKGFLTKVKPSF